MSTVGVFINGIFGAEPINAPNFSVTPVCAIAFSIIGRNASDIWPELVRLKYSVPAVFPPRTICFASAKLIELSASINIDFAAGAASSAAAFMLCSKPSTCAPIPTARSPFSTVCSFSGITILISGLFSNPPGFPVSATAADTPRDSASFNPPAACADVIELASTLPAASTSPRHTPARLAIANASTITRNSSRTCIASNHTPAPFSCQPASCGPLNVRQTSNPSTRYHRSVPVLTSIRALRLTVTLSTPLRLWHLLSLDAPSIAALWTWFIARTLHLALPLTAPVSMFLAVWLLYAADRLLDARQLLANPLHTANLEPRHLFHHHHRNAFLATAIAACLALAALMPRIEPAALRLYLILGALLIAYFLLIHLSASAHRLPKELAVGLFFAAAVFIPTIARRPNLRLSLLLPALLLATLCSLNCLFIYAWEHPVRHPARHPAHPTTRIALHNLPTATATAILLGLVLALLSHIHPTTSPSAISIACTLALTLLLLLHLIRRRLHPTTLRAAADLVLLTPIALLPFLK